MIDYYGNIKSEEYYDLKKNEPFFNLSLSIKIMKTMLLKNEKLKMDYDMVQHDTKTKTTKPSKRILQKRSIKE